jgi:hypothetical protein
VWRVDGGSADPNGKGLDDTVVRMPRITDESVPVLPQPPKARPKAAPKVSAPVPVPVPVPAPHVFEPFSPPTFDSAPDSYLTTASPHTGPMAAVTAAAAPRAKVSSARRTRKARLRLSRVDPWSVMKTSFLFSIAFGIMFWIATSVLWYVITSSGLFDAINAAIVNIISNPGNTETWRIEDYINGNKVLGIAALLAVINVVISTALGTLAAFLYNLSANILGGLELTLAED